ncbi:UNVERIFIED_CONTAM: hypothetical protein K2H54_000745 [Gekko kuhli]
MGSGPKPGLRLCLGLTSCSPRGIFWQRLQKEKAGKKGKLGLVVLGCKRRHRSGKSRGDEEKTVWDPDSMPRSLNVAQMRSAMQKRAG